jgi:mannitol-1-/sugar-/sorbitol-6-phosphatase
MILLPRVYDKVIFDMDGTLVDSQAVVARAWRKWAAKHGAPLEEVLAISHGRRTEEIMRLFVPAGADLAREASDLEAAETADSEDVRAVPGALELLRWIPAGDWAVVTSATRPLALRRLSAAGLPLPHLLVAAEDVTTGKPHPQGYRLAIAGMHARAEECLVFEDAPAGILAAKAAGCDVVAITGTGPCDFPADCAEANDFHCVSFSLKARQPRWWQGGRGS